MYLKRLPTPSQVPLLYRSSLYSAMMSLMQSSKKYLQVIAALAWISCLQYFVVQLIVAAAAWAMPYSWSNNYISDLGNTACSSSMGTYVCSPKHSLMNASFVVLGLTMAIGAVLFARLYRQGKGSMIGFICLVLAGIGAILVGFFPENTIPYMHALGAFLAIGVGNVGMLIIGMKLKHIPQWLIVYTIASGILGTITFLLFGTHTYLGLGIGTVERIAAYPQTIWLIIFGLYGLERLVFSNKRLHK